MQARSSRLGQEERRRRDVGRNPRKCNRYGRWIVAPKGQCSGLREAGEGIGLQ